MSLIAYRCKICGKTEYVFGGEESRLSIGETCLFVALPPNPTTAHSTDTYMSTPQLDCLSTIYELDRILTLEIREEKELAAFNNFRKSM